MKIRELKGNVWAHIYAQWHEINNHDKGHVMHLERIYEARTLLFTPVTPIYLNYRGALHETMVIIQRSMSLSRIWTTLLIPCPAMMYLQLS